MEAFDEAMLAHALADDGLRADAGERMFIDQAPLNTATPYIVISVQSWQDVNDRTRVPEIDATYNVRAIVDVDKDGARLAVRMADKIEAAFKNCTLEVGSGWGVHWCRQRSRFRIPELIDRRNHTSAGGLYQLGAIKA